MLMNNFCFFFFAHRVESAKRQRQISWRLKAAGEKFIQVFININKLHIFGVCILTSKFHKLIWARNVRAESFSNDALDAIACKDVKRVKAFHWKSKHKMQLFLICTIIWRFKLKKQLKTSSCSQRFQLVIN